jgi:3-(3-hydroxy-phenyl)propionate hydroxylase
MMTDRTVTDVAIVGIGPIGATLAGLLGRHEINVVAIDREWDVFQLPRAAHIDHTGLRTLQELGLLESLLPTLLNNAGLDFVTADNQLLARVPGGAGSVSGVPASMYFHQPDLDRRIRQAVAAMPSVDMRLGTEVVGIEPGPTGSLVRCVKPDGGVAEVAAKWVIGCDGAWSLTRETLGLELADMKFEERWLVVDLVLQEPTVTALGASAICRCAPERPTYSIPMPQLRHRFEFMLMPNEDPEQMLRSERTTELVAPWMQANSFQIERSAVYTFHGLVARQWHKNRVLIAGDAAHQMPPFLGQGMCSGLRDAANLAWKLHHVLRHGAPSSLIDTYGSERGVHVRQIIAAVLEYGRVICTIDPEEAAERDRRMLSDPTPPTQRMAFKLPQLPSGELVLEGGGDLFIQPKYDGGPMLDDLIGPRFAVLSRTRTGLGASAQWWTEAVGAFVATLDELPRYAAILDRWMTNNSADVVVVRPDRYVLWAGKDLDPVTARVAPLLAEASGDGGQPGVGSASAKIDEKIG